MGVKNHSIKGWIRCKTRRRGEPLVTKVQPQLDSFLDDFKVGGDYEVMSNAMLRATEAVHSMVISALPVGTQIKIVEIGTDNKRHALRASGRHLKLLTCTVFLLVQANGPLVIG